MLSPRRARGVQKLNSTTTLIQRTTTEAPQRTYVLHRSGCSQEDDQLLRKGCERSSSPGRKSWSNKLGTGQLDEDSSATMDGRHGSNDFHWLDLRSSASACDPGQSGASPHAARHRSGTRGCLPFNLNEGNTQSFAWAYGVCRCQRSMNSASNG
jgi:hypothetical protein